MTKYSDSADFPDISVGSTTSNNKQTAFTNTEQCMGSVVMVLSGTEKDGDPGVGDVVATVKSNQSKILTVTVSPLSPHMFTIPLPNEKIHCIKDGSTGRWFYTGIASDRGMVNFLMNADNITYNPSTNEPFTGDTFIAIPLSARSLNLFEGDVVVQGRHGASLRFTGANPNHNVPWQSSTDSTSPITILRNGYLPTESFNTDSAGVWLTSDQHLPIPLKATLPTDIENVKDTYNAGQVILFSDRIVIGSRQDDIILSSNKTIALCTQEWAHDVDTVLENLSALIDEVKKLTSEVKTQAMASAQQTFPVPGVGTTLISVQSPRFSTSFQNSLNIESKLMELKTNIDTLKQK